MKFKVGDIVSKVDMTGRHKGIIVKENHDAALGRVFYRVFWFGNHIPSAAAWPRNLALVSRGPE